MLSSSFAYWQSPWVAQPAGGISALENTLDEQQVLVLKNGQFIEGKARSIRDGQLIFIRPSEGGQAEYAFSPDEVERLDFPGSAYKLQAIEFLNGGQPDLALPVLRALYQQRAPYLDFIPEDERAFFIKLVETARSVGDPYEAVGVAKNLLAHCKTPANRRRLNDLILLGYYKLPLVEDTRELAQAWISEHSRYGDSALGWYILARLDYDAGKPEIALQTALEPVTFSSQYPMAYLSHCYAVAILAALKLDDIAEALALAGEMQARHLNWPDDEGLEAYAESYQRLLETSLAGQSPTKQESLTEPQN